jgi:hypothetical protein
MNKKTGRQTDEQTCRQTDRNRLTGRNSVKSDRQMDGWVNRLTDRQIDGHPDKQTDRQTDIKHSDL